MRTATAVKCCLGAIGIISMTVAALPAATVDDILKRMEEADRKVNTVSFDFRQDVVYNLTGEKQGNSGTAVFRKPNSLSLSQKNPIEQRIITDGKKVWIYTPAYKQVLVDSWKKWTSGSMVPASLLDFGQNWNELKEKYTFSYIGEENGSYLLLLAPKKKDQWKLRLWIEQERLVPVKASLEGENIAIVTVISNYRINPEVEDSQFKFQPPAGVEVLKMP